ncbi:hypothetical protein M8818_004416 [Zalaria obscura]|uniref:Uncharacterized protein n=1 Tax=Zalaria obscura TaxID=2024903 RepID=A0ACC3SBZ9_9PEZI
MCADQSAQFRAPVQESTTGQGPGELACEASKGLAVQQGGVGRMSRQDLPFLRARSGAGMVNMDESRRVDETSEDYRDDVEA